MRQAPPATGSIRRRRCFSPARRMRDTCGRTFRGRAPCQSRCFLPMCCIRASIMRRCVTAALCSMPRLPERLRGLPEEAAVLEINRWCAEHVVYQPTDERTRSALAVLRAGFGRCGEESMFAVNVLRACGFAARQVYVPRWAHCDDNHAWVEVRCGGAWHFLGACEPEAVLDRGWFNSAAGRAVCAQPLLRRAGAGCGGHRPRGRCGLLQRNGPLC